MARTSSTGRNKPGTVPKGDRKAITVRVPTDQKSHYDQLARESGYGSLSDYICAQMAELHGLEVPAYVHRTNQRDHDALPIRMAS